MNNEKIGVGIIGASPVRSWGVVAHIPAIQALADMEVVAVSTSRQESAQETARTFGIAKAYDNHKALVEDPAVKLVVVAVKVPTHLELVTAAIKAGKHVYCEWPLGNGTEEAERLLAEAKSAGVKHFIGLQSRFSPEVNHLRQLISDGYIGELMSVSLVGPAGSWGGQIDSANIYLLDRTNGATMLSIGCGHLIDACRYACGELTHLKSVAAAIRKTAIVLETGQTTAINVADQIAFVGHVGARAIASMHVHGGLGGGGLRWEVNGSDADLMLTAPVTHIGMLEPVLSGGKGGLLERLVTPAKYTDSADGMASGYAANICRLYKAIADDLRDNGDRAPTFATAVDLHRLLDSIDTNMENLR